MERGRGREAGPLAAIVGMYEEAHALAMDNGFIQDAALAKELSWQVLAPRSRPLFTQCWLFFLWASRSHSSTGAPT
jgi:hypothetical protein